MKQHLVEISARCQKLTEEARELIDPVQAEQALRNEQSAHKNTKQVLESKLAETRIELDGKVKEFEDEMKSLQKTIIVKNDELEIEKQKLKKAVEVNCKYISTQAKLMEKLDQLGAEIAVCKTKEAEWKNNLDRSVGLLEKVLQERDVYHQLAVREHENCRYAINSASSLKLQHLRDLQGMFKKNVVDKGILSKNRSSGHFHGLGEEVKVMKASLGQKVDEIEKEKKERKEMMKQIEEMTEKLQVPVA